MNTSDNKGSYEFKKFGSVDVNKEELVDAMSGTANHFRKEYKRAYAKVRRKFNKQKRQDISNLPMNDLDYGQR
jgi:histidinol dehydrogenase